jgi:hypothetical protein
MSIRDLLPFKKLETSEDNEQQMELRALEEVDDIARELIVSGALLVAKGTPIRIVEALDKLAGERPLELATGNCDVVAWNRERWAYRIGLVAGLRLAQGLRAGAR